MRSFVGFLVGISLLFSCSEKGKNQRAEAEELSSSQQSEKLAVGDQAPDFSLPNPEGAIIKLSEFRGQYVFLDFWASWCQPCRAEHPNLLKVYKKYQGPNFEILGVSFDKKKEAWLKAIKKDALPWVQVSDLKYFDSPMIDLYYIVNVPTTLLLDPTGKIIARDIHADQLDEMLDELLERS